MILKLSIIVVLLFFSQSVYAQTIQVLNESQLNFGLEDKILVENHLTFNPAKPQHLLLSGMYVDSKDSNKYGNFAVASFDNGETWNKPNLFEIPEGADPWGIITKKGNALTTVLGYEELFLFRSENGGNDWNEKPLNLGKYHDHQTMVQDTIRDIIYLVSIKGNDIYVNYSKDDGITFNNPNIYKFSNLSANTMTPIILADGTLLVSFTTFNRPAIGGSRNNGKAERLNKTLSWTIPFSISDGFGTPLFLSESCETGFPVMVNDQSESDFKDNIYYVCSTQTQQSVVFHYSNTESRSWSAGYSLFPYTKGEKEPRNPFTGIPQLTVNNKGIIGIIWQDRTEDDEHKCQYLYFSASVDGGKTFKKPIKVSSELSCMENPKNDWAGKRYKSGGDYTGFIADKNGDFIIIWPDSRNGISKLYKAKVRVK